MRSIACNGRLSRSGFLLLRDKRSHFLKDMRRVSVRGIIRTQKQQWKSDGGSFARGTHQRYGYALKSLGSTTPPRCLNLTSQKTPLSERNALRYFQFPPEGERSAVPNLPNGDRTFVNREMCFLMKR